MAAIERSERRRPGLRRLPAPDLLRHGLQRLERQRRHGQGREGPEGLDRQAAQLAGHRVPTVTSATDGSYSFPNLGPGKWTIEEINQSGWYQTQPANPPGTYSVIAVSGTSQSGLNFGNFQVVTLSGSVYNDVNGDGNQQKNEPNLANWTVDLLNPSGNVVASVLPPTRTAITRSARSSPARSPSRRSRRPAGSRPSRCLRWPTRSRPRAVRT